MNKSQQSRERILTAALEEFSKQGLAGARVNKIASKANVNKERLYAYFGSKEELFEAVLNNTLEKLQEHDSCLLSLTDNDISRLTEILLYHNMKAHEEDPHLWRILAWENLSSAPHINSIKSLNSRGYKHIESLYKKGQRSGVFDKKVSFQTYLTIIIGLTFFYYSNNLTMSQTMQNDLSDNLARNNFIKESLRVLKFTGTKT